MKIGLALSGGGIRGIAHAGVLQALEDNDIKVDMIGGTSAGSLVASLYAMGYSPVEIHTAFKENASKIVKASHMPILSGIGNYLKNKKITLTGLRSGESLEETYNKLAKEKGITNLEQITMPLVIPSVDLITCKEYVFTNKVPNIENKEQYITDISIGKAVRASSSFSAVFSPCVYKKYAFIDGGALDNTPVNEVKKQGADKVIAVTFQSDPITEESNIMDIVMKTIDIMGSKISEESLEMSDLVLNVVTDKTGLLDTQKLDECYDYGYQTVIHNLDKIKKILDI